MSQSIHRAYASVRGSVSPRVAAMSNQSPIDKTLLQKPAFSRGLTAATATAGGTATVKDKGRPTDEMQCFAYLNSITGDVLHRWASMPPGNHTISARLVSEMPAWLPHQNMMHARRLPGGGVVMQPQPVQHAPALPKLTIRPSPTTASGFEYELNGKVLHERSPMADIQLAMSMAESL